MTTSNLMSLPIDIPWERICVSKNMIDPDICDREAPPKWQSSIAVFKYVPEAEFQQDPKYDIIYLKVSVTITGYQPRDKEIEGKIDWNELTTETKKEVESLLNEYHPCTGAIVQVAVAPFHSNPITEAVLRQKTENYPYFIDFEPKKRELFEMSTQTNEKMSRSLQTLNVGKSAKSNQSLEVLDIDMGSSVD
jgi:hypothetical protein